MNISQMDLVVAILNELDRQLGPGAVVGTEGYNAVVQASDLVVAALRKEHLARKLPVFNRPAHEKATQP